MAATQVGRYLIQELLGEGGMARVYKGFDPQLSRPVAIKVINSALADSDDYQQKFRREANIVAKLEDLAVVPIYDFGEDQGRTLYIVMRLMEGGTLAERLGSQRKLSLDETLRTAGRLADTLDRVHKQGVVHLDLKTSNILYNTEGETFIADFGIARFQQAVTRSGRSLSAFTPKYASPEQIDDKDPGVPSDLYSFGLIVYEMLAGRLPFEGSKPTQWMRLHAEAPVANIREYRSDLPKGIEDVFYKILAKEPENRYASAHAFVSDLIAVSQGKQLSSAAKTIPAPRAFHSHIETPQIARRGGYQRWVLVGLGLIVILGLGNVALINLGLPNFGGTGAVTISNTPPAGTVSPDEGSVQEPAIAAVATETPRVTSTTPQLSPSATSEASATTTSTPTVTLTPTKTITPAPTSTITPTIIPEVPPENGELVGSGVVITQATGATGLEVILLNPEGNAWSGVYMAVFAQNLDVSGNPTTGDRVADGRLDNIGGVAFELTPGDYVLCPGDVAGYGFTSRGCIYNIPVERNTSTKVRLQPGRLELAVVYADGTPWEGLYTYVATQKPDVSGNPVEDQRVAEGRINNTGLVSYVLTPGLYLVAMDLPGYTWGMTTRDDSETNLAVRSGDTTRRAVSMGELRIGLLNADGSPAQGVYFQVLTQKLDVSGNPVVNNRVAEGRTDNGGLARVSLTQGEYALQINENTLFNVTVEWGKVTVTDGVDFDIKEP